ncbi:HPP family protein [Mesorhizobium sp. CO1-1-8]|nr:HPP family protein [Mesorhizobium sp. CO1-1-8]
MDVGFAIVVMQMTRTLHLPAGSDPLVVLLAAPTWSFLLILF